MDIAHDWWQWGGPSRDFLYDAGGDAIIVHVGGRGQAVMALRQDDGSVVWRSGSFLVSEAPPELIDFDGERHLVVFAGQAIVGLDPDTGEILWAHLHDAGNDFNFQIPLWSDEDDILFLSSGYIGGSRAIQLTKDREVTRVRISGTIRGSASRS